MKSLREGFSKTLLFLGYNEVYKKLKTIQSVASFSEDKLHSYQQEKLKQLLIHAYCRVPYYKKVLEQAKVVDSQLHVNLENFTNIPILTKDLLRENFEELKADNLDEVTWEFNTSGGSSGEPARFIQDSNYKAWNVANKIYYKLAAGASIGGRELRLWGSERDILEGREDFKIILRNKLYNRVELNMFKMRVDKFQEYIEFWDEIKPEWIEGYVHVMVEFAKYALEHNYKPTPPKGILVTAGTLDEDMRALIEKAFDTKVYNRYGSREVGDIACEDESDKGLRISVWNHYVEVLDSKTKHPTSQMGDVYITNLNNYAMPLIRYEIGDMAEKGEKWDYLKKVNGRITSIFKTRDGGFFDGCYFRTILSYKDWIKQFQIIQHDYDHIEYIFIPKEKDFIISEEEKEEITRNVQKLLGPECRVTFTMANTIDELQSGKYLYTKSNVK